MIYEEWVIISIKTNYHKNTPEHEIQEDQPTQEDNFFQQVLQSGLGYLEEIPSKIDTFINKIDSFAALMSNFIKIGIKISFGKWTKQDTARLMYSISFIEDEIINGDQLHGLLSQNFQEKNIINNYFFKDYTGIRMDNPQFFGGEHQFADHITVNNTPLTNNENLILKTLQEKNIPITEILAYIEEKYP